MPRAEKLNPWVGILYAALVVGLAVVVIAFLNRPNWELIHIQRVEASAQDDVMAVTVLHASCGGPRVQVVEETREFVAVRADHDVRGGCRDIGLTTTIQVELDTALAERNIHMEGSESGGVICTLTVPKTTDVEEGHRLEEPYHSAARAELERARPAARRRKRGAPKITSRWVARRRPGSSERFSV